ncbi:alcohol dehydrogenase catalytic domain-containing protein [Staphylococcus shinii]|jgi:S-(hydroxymethyl)glutathione dehydrogenase/alcohol dehydrogenase|uniref:Glutathione-dependent formaldehyde dehydrogenase n=1 Tax=Staphylococcus shinii TaxID=2912228 RepID=A0A418ICC9_9STAP|nr:alcohol dehydrogenase catalytic domain-containing protein [Staphylococcus shinii]MDW8563665.1 alcohol dehydrogenase catalytic domain-containing protein [Staphylococcus shinii]MDW8566906.1 alcohol dehydrogenase catalytic domain-containing protein [Staphylococcus shinii]MDW8569844.1 alcohol dehydrogenase catalytic domain-containing protein [Staphylococcus shinii]MDW8574253.1 alcohol dehydrogenase catalytic domain-containing protein [Staphylococcus shinii]PKI09612.1 glutathione-dependent forma
MKAVTFQGNKSMEVKQVDDPKIEETTDAIIKITASGICGSDLHLYHQGDLMLDSDFVIGHEPMGIVEEVGKDVKKLKKGDRVVIPFNIGCGECYYCTHEMESQCDNSNKEPASWKLDNGGLFGFGQMHGNHWGGQAEYLRVPYADFSSFVVPDSNMKDEQVLFLSDVAPTAYWSVEHSGVKSGDTVVVLGCGPIGLMAQKFAKLKGAKRVIGVDNVEHRLQHAKQYNQVEVYNFDNEKEIGKLLRETTHGGADIVIDCVGMDGQVQASERKLSSNSSQRGTISPIHTAAEAVSKFGTIQLTGVYATPVDDFPLDLIFNRDVQIKTGQAPVIHLMPKLYDMIQEGTFNPTEIITHTMSLDDAPQAYEIFDEKRDNNIKVVLKPE